ncbi:thioredoxin family protein [Bacillus cereus]|uniref:thioredoxin family protein n=1 Tax=Bacillus cereus TaxID=1396 RepID=UPI001C8B74FE|nr:thioredoxin family protein [Bacillus cereus]MBX9158325.1 thioredoxin family protein [Bacillus cereus]
MESKETKKEEKTKNQPHSKSGKPMKVKGKVKQKRKGTVATLAAVLLITGVGSGWLMYKGSVQAKEVSSFAHESKYKSGLDNASEYKEDNSHLNKLTTVDFKSVLSSGESKIIYLGRPTCPNCRDYRPIQDKVLKDMDMKIEYYNTDDAKKEDMDSFKQILETLKVEGVPTLLKVRDGKVEELAPGDAYMDKTGAALKGWLEKVR